MSGNLSQGAKYSLFPEIKQGRWLCLTNVTGASRHLQCMEAQLCSTSERDFLAELRRWPPYYYNTVALALGHQGRAEKEVSTECRSD